MLTNLYLIMDWEAKLQIAFFDCTEPLVLAQLLTCFGVLSLQ